MFDQPEFEDMLAYALDMIDRALAEGEVPLWERPLRAALDFVKYFIIKIRIGDEESEPGAFNDYVGTEWFKMMHARTVAWYSNRYGEAMNRESGQIVNGCTMVLGTPFVLHVPVVTKRTGTPGETIWVCFPKGRRGRRGFAGLDRECPEHRFAPARRRVEGEEARR